MISLTTVVHALALAIALVAVVVVDGNNDGSLKTLRMVHAIFRHGERNPIQPYENDPYSSLNYWPDGWGQLTQKGKLQSFHLGEYIRQRYSNFISSTYKQEEVFVQCSEYNRSMLSAESVLRGLYGRKESERYNFTIIPLKDDKTIAVSKICPRYSHLYIDFNLQSDVMSKFNEDFADLFKIVNDNTGLNVTYLSRELLYFADSIIIKKERNFTLPLWSEELYNSGQLQFLLTFRFIALDYTKEMKKLRAGPLLQEILENMRNATLSSDVQKGNAKMFLYSGHETTIADILISFGVFDKIRHFPYSSAVFLELHQLPQTNTFFVKLFFKSGFEKEAIKLEIQNCEYFCHIDRLARNLEDIIPKNWEQECNVTWNTSQSRTIGAKTPITGNEINTYDVDQWIHLPQMQLFKSYSVQINKL